MKHGGKKIWNKTNSFIAILIEFISEVRAIKRKESRTVTFTLGDIVFVVYTERLQVDREEEKIDVVRLISARFATNFERGLYYGKY